MELFDGAPVWHASIALQSKVGPVPVEDLQPGVVEQMQQLLKTLIGQFGVGDAHFSTMGGFALHLRRRLSPVETQNLPRGYMETACAC